MFCVLLVSSVQATVKETEMQLPETVKLVMRAEHVYVLSSRHDAPVWPQRVCLWVRDVNKCCRLCCG